MINLNVLTQRQRKIYEAHDELFEAIFNSPMLRHIDPDVLDRVERDQRVFFIDQLLNASSYEYKHQTIKWAKSSVEHSLRYELDALVKGVISIIDTMHEGVKA
jgi:hypothetical protein